MQNKSIQQQIQQLDVFNIVQDAGLKKGFIFYTFGALGFICMILSFGMLLMCNYQRSLVYDKYNIAEWLESMQNTRIQLQIKQGDFNNYNKLSQLYEDSRLGGDVQQLYYQNDYTLINKKLGNQQIQIIPSINYNIGDQNNITIKKNDVLSKEQMQYNNICQDDCIQKCQQYGGQYSTEGCSATYYAEQICYIFDQDQIKSGCFNDEPQIWQFQPTKIIKIQFRRIDDPFIAQFRTCIIYNYINSHLIIKDRRCTSLLIKACLYIDYNIDTWIFNMWNNFVTYIIIFID
ncbi:hypothetical protein pb186bvf_000248 [Paramecium bursaria]